MTDKLLAEGVARNLVKFIQNIRKDQGFNLTDKIEIALENHEAIRPAIEQFKDYICNETLATDLKLSSSAPTGKIQLSEEVELGIEVVKG